MIGMKQVRGGLGGGRGQIKLIEVVRCSLCKLIETRKESERDRISFRVSLYKVVYIIENDDKRFRIREDPK